MSRASKGRAKRYYQSIKNAEIEKGLRELINNGTTRWWYPAMKGTDRDFVVSPTTSGATSLSN